MYQTALKWINEMKEIDNAAKIELEHNRKELSRLDKEEQVVLHEIENGQFDMYRGYLHAKRI